MEYRGNPGTHDISLLNEVLEKLALKEGIVSIPNYDKLLNQGKGERRPIKDWSQVNLPIDLVIVEGWMLGFEALEESKLSRIHSQSAEEDKVLLSQLGAQYSKPYFRQHSIDSLSFINCELKKYSNLFNKLDLMIVLKGSKLDDVFTWREQQEFQALKSISGKHERSMGLKSEEIKRFVERFIPSYELFLPKLYEGFRKNSLTLELDTNRSLLSFNLS